MKLVYYFVFAVTVLSANTALAAPEVCDGIPATGGTLPGSPCSQRVEQVADRLCHLAKQENASREDRVPEPVQCTSPYTNTYLSGTAMVSPFGDLRRLPIRIYKKLDFENYIAMDFTFDLIDAILVPPSSGNLRDGKIFRDHIRFDPTPCTGSGCEGGPWDG